MEFSDEAALDPGRPIIDPHMHLWDIRPAPGSVISAQRFLFEDYEKMLAASGHTMTHTVFVECHAMYRREGPPEFKPLGETEFANGVAAMSASGAYGPCRVAHRIVASANLSLGAAIRPVIEAHSAAAGERFRGIRMPTAYREAGMFGFPSDPSRRCALLSAEFRDGARVLQEMDLSLDVWCFHTQMKEVAGLADALPQLSVILDHIGTPSLTDVASGGEAEARAAWAKELAELARRRNVVIKVGGMGMNVTGRIGAEVSPQTSSDLAARWRPYIETCIETFTPARCMFESNFPPDNDSGSYGAVWNAFKRVTQNFSEDEKDALFRRTAAKTYRIAI